MQLWAIVFVKRNWTGPVLKTSILWSNSLLNSNERTGAETYTYINVLKQSKMPNALQVDGVFFGVISRNEQWKEDNPYVSPLR